MPVAISPPRAASDHAAHATPPPPALLPALEGRGRWRRAGDIAPLALSLLLASMVFWGPLSVFTAGIFAAALSLFYVYWLVRSYAVAVAAVIGLRRLRAWRHRDWQARYHRWRCWHAGAEEWGWPRHLVVIPNYNESESHLSRALASLAAQANAQQIVVVLAMESREPGAQQKAERLIATYRDHVREIFATFHPAGIPGETPGKGSNEAWAARQAYVRLVMRQGDDLRRYTITSCDADAVFDRQHFAALNHLFLTARDRYRTFWQPAIFNSNNIWEVPAPLRIPDGLSGINRLANLVLPLSIKLPTSCYALSWQLLHEVDYWDEEVIPEDWHLYLKCCYALGDRVHVEPLYVPLGNDCVQADGTLPTLRAHYWQALRHAWGASDIPYAWRAARNRALAASRLRGAMLAANLTKVHVLWMAQWYLVTLGVLVPAKLAALGAPMPFWWTHKAFHIPGPGWHPEHVTEPARWLRLGPEGLVEPGMWLNACGFLLTLCILPLIAIIIVELRARPPRPAHVPRRAVLTGLLMWPLMAPITFLWASLPAAHAQWRLATGRGLVYRVAEKGRRASAPATPAVPMAAPHEGLPAAAD